MKILFLDESGDHSLDKIDPEYPLFVLGGVVIEEEYLEDLTNQVQQFKQELFDRDNLILHTADIVRVRNGFEKLTDYDFRQKFFHRLNELMQKLQYSVIACAIRKEDHLAKYGLAALDPYLLSLNVLVERFCFEIGEQFDGGQIIAEKRNPTLDNELELAWLNLKISGTKFLQAIEIKNRITQLVLRDKKQNLAGLQLADLVVSPIGRFLLGKPAKQDWHIIESKFCLAPNGDYMGTGLVVVPKK